MRVLQRSAAAVVVVSCSFAGLASCARRQGPDIQPAVAFLASAVQRHSLVALGEHHGSTETKEFGCTPLDARSMRRARFRVT